MTTPPPVSRKLSWMMSPPLGRTLRLLAREPRWVRPGNWVKSLGLLLRGGAASLLNRLAPPLPAHAAALPPVFIVGFWRSGTTLLHELLCLDPRVAYPCSFDCMAPGHAHWTRDRALPYGQGHFESRRPMDNMVIRLDSPQEDEFFLLNAGARSFYELFLLPEEGLNHLESLDPGGWEAPERERWLAGMARLMRLLARPGKDRAVLKSPTHAFRIPLLRERFPDAVFIHLRRDPLEVFLSTRHTWRANARIYAFHRPSAERDLDPLILACHRLHRKRMVEARQTLGSRWCELDYPDLARDPLGAIEAIYRQFGWSGFESVAPALSAYQSAHADYRTNGFQVADEVERKRLCEALA